MGLIRLELDSLKIPSPQRDSIAPTLQRFLKDMDSDRSSFFHLPETTKWNEELSKIKPLLAARIPQIDTFLHLGIGGSSLGAELLVRALGTTNAPQFHFFENIDPDWIHDTLERVNLKRSLLYVVTKSGNTLETLSQFLHILERFETQMDREQIKNHIVFCTHPNQNKNGALRELANAWKIPTFEIPPNLGGRFSVLSAVGLLPALVAGVDTDQLLKGAADYRRQMLADISAEKVPDVLALAHHLVHLYEHQKRPITVMMPYSQKLRKLSEWFTQLWAESLGKEGKGMTPLAAMGATDQHSILQLLRDGPQDKVVGFVEVQGFQNVLELKWKGSTVGALDMLNGITMNQLMDSEFNATRQVLTNNHKPNFTLVLPKLTAHTMGQTLYMLQVLTAFSGYLMNIDPFDQPGVEEGKVLTQERIIAAKRNLN